MKTYINRALQMSVLLILSMSTLAQGFECKGRVLGIDDVPLENVSVVFEQAGGTSVYTDSLGLFSATLECNKTWVKVIPLEGYHSKRLFLDEQNDVVIRLVPMTRSSLYNAQYSVLGESSKQIALGAAKTIDVDLISVSGANSAYDYLQGRVSGLDIKRHSGNNDGAYASLRGVRSLYTNNQPLLIVDGIPYERSTMMNPVISGNNSDMLGGINLKDIGEITVLKDGDACTLFGSQGSNGVILITTLQPEATQTSIDISYDYGVGFIPKQMTVLNVDQYRTLANEILMSSGQTEEGFRDKYPGLFSGYEYGSSNALKYNHNTNWQDEIYQISHKNDAYVSVKGGSAIARYAFSTGLITSTGVVNNTDDQKVNVNFVSNVKIFEWLDADIVTSMSRRASKLMEAGIAPSTSPLYSAVWKAPFMAPFNYNYKDNNGDGIKTIAQLSYYDEPDALGVSNPRAIVDKLMANQEVFRYNVNFILNANINKNLFYRAQVAQTRYSQQEVVFLPERGMEPYYGGLIDNVAKQQAMRYKSSYINTFLKYNKQLDAPAYIEATLGCRLQNNKYESDLGVSKNTPGDDYPTLSGASIYDEIFGNAGNWNWLSYYLNAKYTYRDRYMVSMSGVLDWSSMTGDQAAGMMDIGGEKFTFLPALSVGWNLASERFMRHQTWLDALKLRASYSQSNNSDIGYYSSRAHYRQVNFREINGVVKGVYNTSLKGEDIATLDFGVDFAILNERLGVEFDVYSTTTSDMLLYEQRNAYQQISFAPTNSAQVSNRGLDLSVYVCPIEKSNFKLDLELNVGIYKNEVLDVKRGDVISEFRGGTLITQEGAALNSFYGLEANGIYSTSAAAEADALYNSIHAPYRAGDVRFVNHNDDDHIINEDDRVNLGSSNPKLFGGLSLSFTYKRWSLSTLLYADMGRDIFNYYRSETEDMSTLHNQASSVLNRWRFEGQESSLPRAVMGDPMGNNDFSSRWIENVTYLRFNHITLAYTVPHQVLFMKNLMAYTTLNNLMLYNNYLGMDPEVSYNSTVETQGVDYGLLPKTVMLQFGLKFGL